MNLNVLIYLISISTTQDNNDILLKNLEKLYNFIRWEINMVKAEDYHSNGMSNVVRIAKVCILILTKPRKANSSIIKQKLEFLNKTACRFIKKSRCLNLDNIRKRNTFIEAIITHEDFNMFTVVNFLNNAIITISLLEKSLKKFLKIIEDSNYKFVYIDLYFRNNCHLDLLKLLFQQQFSIFLKRNTTISKSIKKI